MENDQEAPEGRDYEAEARQQGWKPVDEFDGDPAKHKSAEQFVKDGEEKLPLVLARNKHLNDALDAERRRIKRLEKDFEDVRNLMSTMEKRAYDKAFADIQAEQEAAVETGDIAGFKAASKKMQELQKEAAPETPKAKTKYDPLDVRRTYADFVAENEWFDDGATGGAKKVLTMYAETVADELGELDAYDGTPQEYFAEIAAKVKAKYGERYPAMFGEAEEDDEPKPRKKLSMEGVTPTRRNTARTPQPTDAQREQAKRFVQLGVFPSYDVALKEMTANG